MDDVLLGRARISLAIAEPNAGSDVQGIQTEEVSADGSTFVINSQKKWITSGMYATYFLTLVKEMTGAFTLLLVPRPERLTTRHMVLSGSTTAGTAFVEFDDVEDSVDMVVGERGQGLKYIMSNFNHERLFIAMQSLRCARVCLEDSIHYALSRSTFGKKLVDYPIIWFKIANMGRETESLQTWIESLIFQLEQLPPSEGEFLLAGTTASLKANSGIILEHVVREAVQTVKVLGSRGVVGANAWNASGEMERQSQCQVETRRIWVHAVP